MLSTYCLQARRRINRWMNKSQAIATSLALLLFSCILTGSACGHELDLPPASAYLSISIFCWAVLFFSSLNQTTSIESRFVTKQSSQTTLRERITYSTSYIWQKSKIATPSQVRANSGVVIWPREGEKLLAHCGPLGWKLENESDTLVWALTHQKCLLSMKHPSSDPSCSLWGKLPTLAAESIHWYLGAACSTL